MGIFHFNRLIEFKGIKYSKVIRITLHNDNNYIVKIIILNNRTKFYILFYLLFKNFSYSCIVSS